MRQVVGPANWNSGEMTRGRRIVSRVALLIVGATLSAGVGLAVSDAVSTRAPISSLIPNAGYAARSPAPYEDVRWSAVDYGFKCGYPTLMTAAEQVVDIPVSGSREPLAAVVATGCESGAGRGPHNYPSGLFIFRPGRSPMRPTLVELLMSLLPGRVRVNG